MHGLHARLKQLRGPLNALALKDNAVLAERLVLWRDEVSDSGYRGRFLSGSSKEADVHSLVEHYTAPALVRFTCFFLHVNDAQQLPAND